MKDDDDDDDDDDDVDDDDDDDDDDDEDDPSVKLARLELGNFLDLPPARRGQGQSTQHPTLQLANLLHSIGEGWKPGD